MSLKAFENDNGDLCTAGCYLRDAKNRLDEAIYYMEQLTPRNSPILLAYIKRMQDCSRDLSKLRSENY